MSVGARHADCNTSPELARKDLNQEDIDTPFSGGFTLNLDDAESEGETEREEGGRGEGRENGVKMKPGHKRELMKIMSGYDLTGIVGIIPIFIQIKNIHAYTVPITLPYHSNANHSKGLLYACKDILMHVQM